MDRRTFVRAGLSSLLTYNCGFARARAATTVYGCIASASEGSFGVAVREEQTKFNQRTLGDVRLLASRSSRDFSLRPGIGLYNDRGGPNALAYPQAFLPNGPDGTVLVGVNLFDAIVRLKSGSDRKVGLHVLGEFTLPTIISHEFGHIMQYKRGMSPGDAWQMEPHADFLAGWSLGQSEIIRQPPEEVIKAFFNLGDYTFNDHHHGEKEFRAAMVRIGYDLRDLDVNEAFERGKQYAGLN